MCAAPVMSAVNILSIQSWVAFGHVGNASAVFPLQRLGAEVWAINTVQFSNHPGYGSFTGQVFAPDAIRALVDGVAARGALPGCDALLSGYVGDAGTGEVILDAACRVREANPRGIWCCDPVIGDEGPGIYVRPGVAAFFRDRAVPQADLLTPNHFELKYLTGLPCDTLDGARQAVAALQARMPPSGPRIVLVTSLRVRDTPDDAIDCLAGAAGNYVRLRVPKLPLAPNGAGDAMAALFLFHILRGGDLATALERAAAAVHGVLRGTLRAGARELALIACQEEFIHPSQHFASQAC